MRVEQIALFKFEKVGHADGVLTLVSPDGGEVESVLVSFEGNQHSTLGASVKYLIKRAEHTK